MYHRFNLTDHQKNIQKHIKRSCKDDPIPKCHSLKTFYGVKATFVQPANTVTVYVDAVNGNDNHTGNTVNCPKKTLQSAVDETRLNQNVTINLAPGTYDTPNNFTVAAQMNINGSTKKVTDVHVNSVIPLVAGFSLSRVTIDPVSGLDNTQFILLNGLLYPIDNLQTVGSLITGFDISTSNNQISSNTVYGIYKLATKIVDTSELSININWFQSTFTHIDFEGAFDITMGTFVSCIFNNTSPFTTAFNGSSGPDFQLIISSSHISGATFIINSFIFESFINILNNFGGFVGIFDSLIELSCIYGAKFLPSSGSSFSFNMLPAVQLQGTESQVFFETVVNNIDSSVPAFQFSVSSIINSLVGGSPIFIENYSSINPSTIDFQITNAHVKFSGTITLNSTQIGISLNNSNMSGNPTINFTTRPATLFLLSDSSKQVDGLVISPVNYSSGIVYNVLSSSSVTVSPAAISNVTVSGTGQAIVFRNSNYNTFPPLFSNFENTQDKAYFAVTDNL